jgi:hypothetical protein
VDQFALTQWRIIRTKLIESGRTSATRLGNSEGNIENLTNTLYAVLLPFVKTEFMDEAGENIRRENLRVIITAGVKFGQLLFAHPFWWEFDWNPRGPVMQPPNPSNVPNVVFPALLMVSDDVGRWLNTAIVKLEQEVDETF